MHSLHAITLIICNMEKITIDDFKKCEIRIGTVVEAIKLEDSNKLLKLTVDFGSEKRFILAGIAKFYTPEQIVGKQCPFVFNLEPKMLGVHESQGMILCVDSGAPILLHPDKPVAPGSLVK
jgi:methionyl-tRNA synthetase